MTRIQEYEIYHERVTEYCVELMGEVSREHFEKHHSFFREFQEGIHPRMVAQQTFESMRGNQYEEFPMTDEESEQWKKKEPIQESFPD